MQKQPAPKSSEEDEVLLGIMTFYLDCNVTETNEIRIKRSELKSIQESLIREIQDKEDKGFLVIKGTTSSPLDITMIPLKRMVCFKFTIKAAE